MKMQKIKLFLRSEVFIECLVVILISALTYLIFVPKFGYYNDDWYLMYAAKVQGPQVFWGIFSIDRPLRALVMIPAYTIFGSNPIYYNLSAFLFRLIGGFSFFWIVRTLWRDAPRTTFWMSLLFMLYPGFLSQPNAIDYLCHQAGFAAGLFSIALTIKAVEAANRMRKILLYLFSILLGWFYLGQIEWYIGLEFFRLTCVFIIVFRFNESSWHRLIKFFKCSLPVLMIPIVFLAWRLFYFESKRSATDAGLQLSGLLSAPLNFILNFLSTLFDDFLDVLLRAWFLPLYNFSLNMNIQDWLPAIGVVLFILIILRVSSRIMPKNETAASIQELMWRREAITAGVGVVVFGLFPVLLAGRGVDFHNYSRYTLIASIGAALLLPALLNYINNLRLRNLLFSILILSASLTHYANGFAKVRETNLINQFWWQVSWRIPQLEQRTTLVVNYADIALQEDYFVWGPANLIYYPQSMRAEYPQPSIYSLVLNDETIQKILAGEKQDFRNRRSIRTYSNYSNILILTLPSNDSCVQVILGSQPEYSTFEDNRIIQIGMHSEADHILTQDAFHAPPLIPFGAEPEHSWCFYFQKAALARQADNWDEIVSLAGQAFNLGLYPKDQIEWIPFLQAYATKNDLSHLAEIQTKLTNSLVKKQVCEIFKDMESLPSKNRSDAIAILCFE